MPICDTCKVDSGREHYVLPGNDQPVCRSCLAEMVLAELLPPVAGGPHIWRLPYHPLHGNNVRPVKKETR